jgi:hypothetical protein
MLLLDELSEIVLNLCVRVVWTIYTIIIHLTSILALLFNITRNGNHKTNVLSLLSRVDNKLFPKNSKQSAYAQQRSHVMVQLWIILILFGVASASCAYAYSDGTWIWYIYIASQILCTAINTVMRFQYVNIVLLVKQRYTHVKHLLSEADSTTDVNNWRCMYVEDVTSNSNKKMFSPATINWKSNRESHNVCTIHDLQIIYCELYDVLYANIKSSKVLYFLT